MPSSRAFLGAGRPRSPRAVRDAGLTPSRSHHPRPRRRGPRQPHHRRAARQERKDGAQPALGDLRQARRAQPRAGDRQVAVGLSDACDPGARDICPGEAAGLRPRRGTPASCRHATGPSLFNASDRQRAFRGTGVRPDMTQIDETKLNEFVGRVLGDLGGAVSVPLVRIGDALGLYAALKRDRPGDSRRDRGGSRLRSALRARMARGAGRLRLCPPRGRAVLADAGAGLCLRRAGQPGQPDRRLRYGRGDGREPGRRCRRPSRPARGVAWGEQAGCMFCAVARLFRPGYVNALVQEWLPALDGVVDKLKAGAAGRRRRLRPWPLDDPDGAGLPEVAFHRLRLPSGLDRRRDRACARRMA